MAQIIDGLKYTNTHEWLKVEGDTALIGLADFAQDALGDLVFVGLPEVGDEVVAGEAFGDVESVKAVSDMFSPANGEVVEVNEELLDNPALINEDPYGAWIIKIAISGEGDLMDSAAYADFVAAEEA